MGPQVRNADARAAGEDGEGADLNAASGGATTAGGGEAAALRARVRELEART